MHDLKMLERVARRMRMEPYELRLLLMKLCHGPHMREVGLTFNRLLSMYDRAFNSMKVYQHY